MHSRKSPRAYWWDYRSSHAYFVTANTKMRYRHFLGEVVEGKMIHSKAGQIAYDVAKQIPKQFPFVELDAFVIMPDHFHMLIRLTGDGIDNVYTAGDKAVANYIKGGSTRQHSVMIYEQHLSKVVRWFKGRCSFEIHKVEPSFAWQRSFHDRILRNKEEYDIRFKYIKMNPLRWTWREKRKLALAKKRDR